MVRRHSGNKRGQGKVDDNRYRNSQRGVNRGGYYPRPPPPPPPAPGNWQQQPRGSNPRQQQQQSPFNYPRRGTEQHPLGGGGGQHHPPSDGAWSSSFRGPSQQQSGEYYRPQPSHASYPPPEQRERKDDYSCSPPPASRSHGDSNMNHQSSAHDGGFQDRSSTEAQQQTTLPSVKKDYLDITRNKKASDDAKPALDKTSLHEEEDISSVDNETTISTQEISWWNDFTILKQKLIQGLPKADHDALDTLQDGYFEFPADFGSKRQSAIERTCQFIDNEATRTQQQQQVAAEDSDSVVDSSDSEDSYEKRFQIVDTMTTSQNPQNSNAAVKKSLVEKLANSPELILGFFSIIPCDESLEKWCICPFGPKAKGRFSTEATCKHDKRIPPSSLLPHLREMASRCSKHRLFLIYLKNLFVDPSETQTHKNLFVDPSETQTHKDFYDKSSKEYEEILSAQEEKTQNYYLEGMTVQEKLEQEYSTLDHDNVAKRNKIALIDRDRVAAKAEHEMLKDEVKKILDTGDGPSSEEELAAEEKELAQLVYQDLTASWRMEKSEFKRTITLGIPFPVNLNDNFRVWYLASTRTNARENNFLFGELESGTSGTNSCLWDLRVVGTDRDARLLPGNDDDITLQNFLSAVWADLDQLVIEGVPLFEISEAGFFVPAEETTIFAFYRQATSYFRAIGRLIGLCILHGRKIPNRVLPRLYRNYLLQGKCPTDESYSQSDILDFSLEMSHSRMKDLQDEKSGFRNVKASAQDRYIDKRMAVLTALRQGIALFYGELYDKGGNLVEDGLVEDDQTGGLPYRSMQDLFALMPSKAIDFILFEDEATDGHDHDTTMPSGPS